uniref:NADH-ubiquinone oxidoreductase chain 1 n=1 Tax=Hycleus marcipoli TaxID=1914940 RepID=A0A343A7D6_9CUCU|nr:NADH dehydrogenase subunit 1 [Hycleus marcipoli]APB02790.1 NADH dehydrogenase subunit 1 [Hycleus marcipoli]
MYFLDLVGIYISMLFMVVCILIGVAYLTLLERKVLGYIQIRKGPNKVGFWGILQPFSDAIKLFSKEQTFPYMANLNIYYLSPAVNLFISLLLWMCMPFFTVYLNFSMSILFFLAVSSLMVYSLMLAGWSSNSGYSLLGSLRAVAQTISYEVSLALIFMSFIYLILSMNILDFMKVQKFIWLLFLMFPLSLMWVISGLAETNRTPFDFAEGESELVSGFNIEYSSGGFALIFLAEYSSILFMSMLCILIFMGGNIYSLWFFFKLTFLSFFWVWARGTLPRFRYDKLMYLAWKSLLPSSLMYLIFFFSFKAMLFSLFL